MAFQPLVINSKLPIQAEQHSWRELTSMPDFSKKIITQETGKDADINALSAAVSGMPTIFARANMFRLALETTAGTAQEQNGLLLFYTNLIEEWKGLISCIAINQDKISVERINLVYGNNDDSSSVDNIYSIAGSFGNVLFERDKLWSDPSDANPKPFIDVILYEKNDKKIVVGGTSPDSLFFTSAGYNLDGESASYINTYKSGEDNSIGKFINPLSKEKINSFDPNELKKLWSYVRHLRKNANKFNESFNKPLNDLNNTNPDSYHDCLLTCLDSWIDEMDNEIKSRGILSQFEEDEIPQISFFHGPFAKIANNSNDIFVKGGVIYEGDYEDGGLKFQPKDLLLPESTRIACVCDEDNPKFLENRPLLLLKATIPDSPDQIRHFLLPFTPLGLKVFGNTLPSVLGLDDSKKTKSRLTAQYIEDDKTGISKLHVELTIKTSTGKSIGAGVPMIYNVTNYDLEAKDVLVWPNFVSKEWKKYYLFSEMPHNSDNWSAIPFCMELDGVTNPIICEPNSDNPLLIAKNGLATNDHADLLVDYNQERTNSNNYEYEIFESKNPFKGFKITHQKEDAGYAIINYENDLIEKKSSLIDLEEAHVGIDFGSTNSAIAYRVGNGDAQGYKFKNRRLSLFAPRADDKNNEVYPAVEDEVLFFQNDEIHSNEIKSVLSIHDQNRLTNTKNQDFATMSAEMIKGGFPCFEKNLPIENSDNKTHTLNFSSNKSIGRSVLIHNMKWDDDNSKNELLRARRKAYLKSLVLHMYADLFEKNYFPKTLKWAYPSAMGDTQRSNYKFVWDDLKTVNPLSIDKYGLDVKQPKTGDIGMSDSASFNTGSNTANDFGGDDSFDLDGWGDDSLSQEETKKEDENIGWGDEESEDNAQENNLEYADGSTKFKFIKENSELSMTESSAVARYIMADKKNDAGISKNKLTMCFDIGGSTTDILVLGVMGRGRKCMIKQSSIRFAAQRVAQSAKYSPKFFSVIKNFLDEKKITVEGINSKNGANKFTKDTASYYFEQIVDRLSSEDERNEFYRKLAIDCKELFCINLYVTGLIIFYAGQLAKKIKLQIDEMDEGERNRDWSGKPVIELKFTGKGSRIMDWMNAFDEDISEKYYKNMFIKGFGGMEEAKKHLKPVRSFFAPRTDENLRDIKYEVAYGLASPKIEDFYVNDDKDNPLEIIGEEGFILYTKDGGKKTLSSHDFMNQDYIEMIGDAFALMPESGKPPCPKFSEFAILYYTVAQKFFDLKLTKDDFVQGFNNMNIVDYIKLTPEYRMGKENLQNDKKFGFVAPIIILEGMKFLENTLLKKIN
jgi:hypothetical protein